MILRNLSLRDGDVTAEARLGGEQIIETQVAPIFTDVETNREKLVRLYPLRRLGLASDVAPMVAMLASPRSGWITGQVLSISGGFSMI